MKGGEVRMSKRKGGGGRKGSGGKKGGLIK